MYLVLDNIRSSHNVGTIFRTSDALSVEHLYLGGICPGPLDKYGLRNNKLCKVSLGSENIVSYSHESNLDPLISQLIDEGCLIVSLEINEDSYDIYDFLKNSPEINLDKLVLVLGNEVEGISKSILEKSHHIVHLPMGGLKESLNVSVAYSIAAYTITFFSKLDR